MKRVSVLSTTIIVMAFGASGDADAPVALSGTEVGRPTAEKVDAARKINDLIVFGDRLYIGHGDYTVNTGPTDVIYMDLNSGQFNTEFAVDEEAIALYRIVDGQLVIPGVDATEEWDFGNIYVRGGQGWEKRRTLANAIHVFDVVSCNGAWFAATGVALPLSGETSQQSWALGGVFASGDQGRTWSLQYTTTGIATATVRADAMVAYRDRLLVFPSAFTAIARPHVRPEVASSLDNPMKDGDAEFYFFSIPDPAGPAEAVALSDGQWRAADLIPTAGVFNVDPFVFRDQLVMVVGASADPVPVGHHHDVAKRGLPAGVTVQLWTYDGTESRPLAEPTFDAVKDVLARDDSVSLLVLKAGKYFIVETSDLQSWTWFALPPSAATPLSIERTRDGFYIGHSDGLLLKATRAK